MTSAYNLSRRGDPKRSVQLLWRLEVKPSRGPKPGLSLDQIVAAAIGVADAEGLRALSMRRVADRLGVGTMSLHRCVPPRGSFWTSCWTRSTAISGNRPTRWRDGESSSSSSRGRVGPAISGAPGTTCTSSGLTLGPRGPNVLASFEAMLASVVGIGLRGSQMVAVVNWFKATSRAWRAVWSRQIRSWRKPA